MEVITSIAGGQPGAADGHAAACILRRDCLGLRAGGGDLGRRGQAAAEARHQFAIAGQAVMPADRQRGVDPDPHAFQLRPVLRRGSQLDRTRLRRWMQAPGRQQHQRQRQRPPVRKRRPEAAFHGAAWRLVTAGSQASSPRRRSPARR